MGLESILKSLDIKCLSLSLWDTQERNSSLEFKIEYACFGAQNHIRYFNPF
ncbi:hypothetical protein APHNP_1680 [Anaplasma phagocytophilum str. ApNP]|uniref:Uncharacterized protein n=2 Tax=Anaplasma phagocytophilum TaxID=948 RepID=A0A0F3NF97_ANAPH|nr:hypothetical protein APHMUC_0115 [Anaplasma phagocytophilum str. ApMUC09]KJV66748.1 hypothetical protein APHNP_1680 [Anaplasma phagocytophilum str. ApNP]